MQKVKCIIIEDEPLAAKLLSDYVNQVPGIELAGSFKNALSAGNYLQNEQPHLIFLDIHLPQLKGLSFLRTLANPPMVVVTTAYHQYAVESFELNVVDYLLKPFSFERFLTAANKVRKLMQEQYPAEKDKTQKDSALTLTIDRKKIRIEYDHILYTESRREYVKVITLTKEYLSKITTTEMEVLLPASRFMRIHRSFIIARNKIGYYTKSEVEINGKIIPVGKAYKNIVLFPANH